MPHLTFQMTSGGPVIDIRIGVSAPRAQALQAAGLRVPASIIVRGWIDTGASCTCVDPVVLQALGITATGSVPVLTPSTGNVPHICNLFDVSLTIAHATTPFQISSLAVMESHLSAQGIQALIGRDVLSSCLLIYNGTDSTFTISF